MSAASQLDLGDAEPARVAGLAALQTGADGAPVVLLVPGYTGSKEDFGPILAPLAGAGLHAVAIDLPGQHESPGPVEPDFYTTASLGEVVRAVARELAGAGPVQLLGHSFGGLVARAAVVAEPSLFASLVLMDSGPGALGGNRAALITYLEPMLASDGIEAVYAATEAIYAAQPGYVAPAPELAALLRSRFVAGSPAMLQGMGRTLRTEPDTVADLAATGIPTLVLYGEDDDAWLPEVQDEMAQRLGAAVVRIPHAVHSPAVENPAATAAALIDFWRRLPSRATLRA
ncbi:alpha/beta fold hydrolase [Jatrophihabitans sp.]|uniref:alpha/beta fold hydrolase n=1 Tax=Jatrophihabitans sp. TaxID=1932789 RepID=UPI0030C743D7|nr:Alpha/beta hydrolase [Jatrophihabitans sp.]